MNFKIILLIVVACLAVVFVIQNVSAVTVSIFSGNFLVSCPAYFLCPSLWFCYWLVFARLICVSENKKEVTDIQNRICVYRN